jgi:hypothetical protein
LALNVEDSLSLQKTSARAAPGISLVIAVIKHDYEKFILYQKRRHVEVRDSG